MCGIYEDNLKRFWLITNSDLQASYYIKDNPSTVTNLDYAFPTEPGNKFWK